MEKNTRLRHNKMINKGDLARCIKSSYNAEKDKNTFIAGNDYIIDNFYYDELNQSYMISLNSSEFEDETFSIEEFNEYFMFRRLASLSKGYLALDKEEEPPTENKPKIEDCNSREENIIIHQEEDDEVHHPAHYTQGSIECIDAIKAVLGKEGAIAFCKGNVMKYVWRCDLKNHLVDLKKAQWYLDKAIELTEE